jgi:hypothetical protein
MQEWIEQEIETLDFGDKRLNKRFKKLMDSLSRKPTLSIPGGCEGWTETIAAYRFFNNGKVAFDPVLKPHKDSTFKRINEYDVALMVQDTTELDMTRPNEHMTGAGPMNDNSRVGFFAHTALMLTEDGIPLGVIGADIWSRDEEEFAENQKDKKEKVRKKKQKPIEEKESYRWVQNYRLACKIQNQAPDTKIVCISDSEGDIYECFSESVNEDIGDKAEWIVRGCQDRSLSGGKKGDYPKLLDKVSSSKILGEVEITVSKNEPKSHDNRKRKQFRSARTATASIQAKKVKLKAPFRKGIKLPNVEMNAVLVREINPPKEEPPVEWLLLTSLSIDATTDVRKVIEYYCKRWQIEIYFRVLKSGCKVEERQLETEDRYKPCLALYMIIAWRIMFVMMLGRECPDMPCDTVLSEAEWKSVYQIRKHKELPRQVPALHEMICMIAGLGGYLGRKHDGPPGPQTMWIGMQRMMDFAQAWRVFGPNSGSVKAESICV